MTGKITTILAAAIVLASAGVASAQTNRHAGAQWQAHDKSALRSRKRPRV